MVLVSGLTNFYFHVVAIWRKNKFRQMATWNFCIINWVGVVFRFDDGTNKFKFENVGETNNNGLGYTVELLEHIYTDPEFPKNLAPSLSISLKASGKSRADLWALATIAAVEYAVETNNLVCDGISYYQNPAKQCNQELGTDQCHVNTTWSC